MTIRAPIWAPMAWLVFKWGVVRTHCQIRKRCLITFRQQIPGLKRQWHGISLSFWCTKYILFSIEAGTQRTRAHFLHTQMMCLCANREVFCFSILNIQPYVSNSPSCKWARLLKRMGNGRLGHCVLCPQNYEWVQVCLEHPDPFFSELANMDFGNATNALVMCLDCLKRALSLDFHSEVLT